MSIKGMGSFVAASAIPRDEQAGNEADEDSCKEQVVGVSVRDLIRYFSPLEGFLQGAGVKVFVLQAGWVE
jgi:hypothetical protein